MDPQTVVNIMVEIAELEDLQIQARHTLAKNKRLDHDLHELQAEYEDDAAQAEAQVQDQARTIRAIDQEIRQTEARIADRKDRLIGVSDRRQHKALSDEIASLKNKLSSLEDEALAFLDDEEGKQAEAGQAQDESRDHGQQTEARLQEMGEESTQLKQRLVHIEEDLQRLIGMLPPAEKRHVVQLRQKLERAVVFLHNGACCGCFNQLPAQEAINVDRGRTVIRCRSCMCYVVHRSWK